MDPITASILAALAAGVTEGLAADLYKALVGAIRRKFGKESKLAQAVDAVEEEPAFEPNQTALAGRVQQANAAQDEELLTLAQELRTALEQHAEGRQAVGKYNIQIHGGEVGIIGDHAHIEGGLHFGKKS